MGRGIQTFRCLAREGLAVTAPLLSVLMTGFEFSYAPQERWGVHVEVAEQPAACSQSSWKQYTAAGRPSQGCVFHPGRPRAGSARQQGWVISVRDNDNDHLPGLRGLSLFFPSLTGANSEVMNAMPPISLFKRQEKMKWLWKESDFLFPLLDAGVVCFNFLRLLLS